MAARTSLSVFLRRLSKHIALLVCFMILGKTSHRLELSQLAILGWAAAGSLLEMTGLVLELRRPWDLPRQSGSR